MSFINYFTNSNNEANKIELRTNYNFYIFFYDYFISTLAIEHKLVKVKRRNLSNFYNKSFS